MYLTEVSKNDIKIKRVYKPSRLFVLLEQFATSGIGAAKIEGGARTLRLNKRRTNDHTTRYKTLQIFGDRVHISRGRALSRKTR